MLCFEKPWLPLLAIVIVPWLAMIASAQSASSQAAADGRFESAAEQQMFQAANQERLKRGLPELKWEPKLNESARKHAERMAQFKRLSHQLPGEPALSQRVAETGLRFSAAAENVAYATDAEDLHPALMESPPHRANILSPKYNSMGIGVVTRAGILFAVENFTLSTDQVAADQAEKILGDTFNQLRLKQKLSAVPVSPSLTLREALCHMAGSGKLDAGRLPVEPGTSASILFTAMSPVDLPDRVVALAGTQVLRRVIVGSCFMVTSEYPGGAYWFALSY